MTEANNALTSYQYDPLGNLTNVSQSGQTRQFQYDSLSRLRFANNPENGITTYDYYPNGNVQTVVQGGVTRTYNYDATNRVTKKTYIDYAGAGIAPTTTPQVIYTYDQGVNAIGHLTQITNGVATTSFPTFDAMGRVTSSSQTTPTLSPGSFGYSYNLAGGLETETYPSNRTVTTCYDGANRVANVTGKSSPTATTVTYASGATTANMHYTAHGAVDQLKLGNGLFEQTNFNSRLQVTGINLGTSLGSNSVWAIGNGYAASGYNNGNLLTHSITVQGTSLAAQTFLYDPVSRLQIAAENPSNASVPVCPDASSHWCELFGYDNYGNRSMTQSTNVGVVAPAGFSAASNRITDSGWGYDQAGNLNQDLGGQSTYKYDAENRLVAACAYTDGPATCTDQVAAGRTLYGYDGEGRRVTKRTADGTLTTFVYDATGALAAEYGGVATTNGPEYLTADHLGSTRVVTNALQEVVARHDFRPFGDEIPGTGVRQGITGYGLDGSVKQMFSGKERDTETGLDYFQARYMSSAQGRFTSPDPLGIMRQKLLDPQQWNMYTYARNNPLAYGDFEGNFIYYIHETITRTVLTSLGYSAPVIESINRRHGAQDSPANNNDAHAYMHAQASHRQDPVMAFVKERNYIRTSLSIAADAVLDGDLESARAALGNALHDAQDEKHEFTPFELHSGSVSDALNPLGRYESNTDLNPNKDQLDKAMRRTREVERQFEDLVWTIGRLRRVSEGQIGERLYEFKNNLWAHEQHIDRWR